MTPTLMKKLVRASACWNVMLAAAAFEAGFAGLDQAASYFNLMIGAFLCFTSAVLILAARSLEERASIVF